ncbi:MAG: PilZ domain-containing protein [Myxococcota bacterium]|nr:PilZ domain-containing protein [Myxococcota bacterium]
MPLNPHKTPVLLVGFGEQGDTLRGRLSLLNFRGLRAEDAGQALEHFENSSVPIRAALFPAAEGPTRLSRTLERIRKEAPLLELVAIGDRPGNHGIKSLRELGARFCLWDEADDGGLRFVLNQALYDRTRGETRDDLRVPTGLVARVTSGTGNRVAVVYNLSTTGAYLETHRPMMPGAKAGVAIPLDGSELALRVEVISANVPGNLQRPNLPLGMGVRFEDVEADAQRKLEGFVRDRAEEFKV